MQPYQPHRITRNRVIVGLVISTMLAACTAPAVDRTTPSETSSTRPKPIPATTSAQAKADAVVNAAKASPEEIRFTDLDSCKVETERLQAEYGILKEAFDAGRLTGKAPIKPTLEPEECEAFLAAAEQEYAAQAPTYVDQQACEASGAQCERVDPSPNNNYIQPVYRPSYFGGYFYNPWATPIYIGGRRDYSQHTRVIYRDQGSNFSGYSSGTGSTTTNTRPTSSTSTGTTSTTTTTTPKTSNSSSTTTKPASKSGTNAITGRGTSGFGSSYKYTGKGGK